MFPLSTWYQICACRRTFTSPKGFTNHKRTCKKFLAECNEKMDKFKEDRAALRRLATEPPMPHEPTELLHCPAPADLPLNGSPLPNSHQQVRFFIPVSPSSLLMFMCISQTSEIHMAHEELDESLAQRRTRREYRRLPKRYRDVAPEPPAPLPPPFLHLQAMPVSVQAETRVPCSLSLSPTPPPASLVRKILKSSRNVFGIFRQYHTTRFPDHDPSEHITLSDLNTSSSTPDLAHNYSPYPNLNSYLLGDWYWNDGEKKSQSSFQHLIQIVGHPDFRPEDVAGNNWRRIDAQLSGDRSNKEGDWEDDEGWIKTPIRINAPFHGRQAHPGPQEFDAGILHHRKLIPLIRERITRSSVHPHLHFEPYKLFWQPNNAPEPVRVHGELYTSEAFIEAHGKLQDSPPEPGCDLPRVVLGLMFASDGTHLTSFSTAKLWPVYLTIGNESKDRRSRTSCKAFEHVAYLETVSNSLYAKVL